jgi:serine phosphatase RsbU (regulator of sigma subunit)/two-component sensor histidine kinase
MSKNLFANGEVLVVDDDQNFCQVVRTYLQGKSISIQAVGNVLSAQKIVTECEFTVILLGNFSPGGRGIEFLRFLREKHISTPVLMVTCDDNQTSMGQYFTLGVSSYLLKPIKMELLWLVLQRCYCAYQNELSLQLQNKHLELLLDEQQQEEYLARHVYRHLSKVSSEQNPAIRTHMLSSKAFSGDFFISEQSINGNSLMMLMDATGHGLPAAISILPVVSTTRAMLQKGMSLGAIIHEINLKLFTEIPEDRFVAVIGIEIDHQRHEINIINAGMPDVLLLNDDCDILHTIHSHSLPLGIVDKSEFSPKMNTFPWLVGQHLFFYSDGLTEQRSSLSQAFGKKGLFATFAKCQKTPMIFDEVITTFQNHCANTFIEDDASVCYVDLQKLFVSYQSELSKQSKKLNGNLYFNVDLAGNLLTTTNLVTTVDDLLRRMNLSTRLRQKAFTVVSELVNNALDHGVLQLESTLKQNLDGFSHYLEQRDMRLKNVNPDDRIKFSLHFEPELAQLSFAISDSGQGYQHDLVKEMSEEALFGRGLKLVQQLCEHMQVFAPGNRTSVIIK